jgi:hypothetical protein
LNLGRYYLETSARRIRRSLADLWDNDDNRTSEIARMVLKSPVVDSGGAHGPAH